MSEVKSNRQIAEERADANGSSFDSFKDAGAASVRSLVPEFIPVGTTFTIPTDYKVRKEVIRGTTNSYVYVITEEGLKFPISMLTRGAMPIDGGEYVPPTGTVIEDVKNYGDMDKLFKECLAGNKITYASATEVIAKGFGDDETRTVKVPELNYAA